MNCTKFSGRLLKTLFVEAFHVRLTTPWTASHSDCRVIKMTVNTNDNHHFG